MQFDWKFLGNGVPVVHGNKDSSFICFSIHSIRRPIYCGAVKWVGFLYWSLSHHKYSYFGPPDICGQVSFVQSSATTPYNRLIRLKKSTTWTAIQSFNSSDRGSFTVSRRSIPADKVSSAWRCNSYLRVPGSNFFFGRNVLYDLYWFKDYYWLNIP